MRKRMMQSLLVAMAFVLAQSAAADAVQDSIDAARKAYEAGKYNEAIKELEFAAQMVRQKQAKQLEAVFPAPLADWSARKPKVQVAGRAFLGGGISASRVYEKGDARITIEITMNSPLLQTFLGFVGNPMFVGPDQQLVRVQGHRALLKFDPSAKSGELTLAVERKVLVAVRGRGIDSEEALLGYANGIHFQKLEEVLLK